MPEENGNVFQLKRRKPPLMLLKSDLDSIREKLKERMYKYRSDYRKAKKENDLNQEFIRGNWDAMDYQWHDWCKNEMPHWIRKNNFELEVEQEDILQITKDNFKDLPRRSLVPGTELMFINWELIKEKHTGFEVHYQYGFKIWLWDHKKLFIDMFISSLDCDSGCVWDLSVIKKVRKK